MSESPNVRGMMKLPCNNQVVFYNQLYESCALFLKTFVYLL